MTGGSQPLLTPRAALIILLAALVAIATGILTYLVRRSAPEAILAAGSAFGASLLLANSLISS